jgi:hypothetical protein
MIRVLVHHATGRIDAIRVEFKTPGPCKASLPRLPTPHDAQGAG